MLEAGTVKVIPVSAALEPKNLGRTYRQLKKESMQVHSTVTEVEKRVGKVGPELKNFGSATLIQTDASQ